MNYVSFSLLPVILASTFLPILAATSQVPARPTLYGRVLVFNAQGTREPLPNVSIQLFELKAAADFGLTSSTPLVEVQTDLHGLYGLYTNTKTVTVYRLEVHRGKDIGTGTIIRATPGVTARVPDLAVDWKDPCRHLYGTGYATDFIRTRVDIPWRANSYEWLSVGPRAGWPPYNSRIPAPGMIAVFPRNASTAPFGHVAMVESVDSARGTFVVSQWNEPPWNAPSKLSKCSQTLAAFGTLTTREWRVGDPAISGFIRPVGR